jgi:DNA polymerase (family 10)
MKNKLLFLLTKKIKPNEIKKINNIKLVNELIDFAGIGKTKADSLIKSGLTKITDLNKKIYKDQLNDATKLLMKYKPLRKIPIASIKKIEKLLTDFPNSQIVGGFRRKKQYSKDIDVMLISDSKHVLDNYLNYLNKNFKEIHVYSKGVDKVSLLILISPKKYFKIDVFRTPISSKYAMLLYSTGSKEFNIRMRSIASRMNYLLNQTGIYKVPNKTPIKVKSEKDFFNILNMDYVEPWNR